MRSLYAKDNSGTANDGPLLPFLQSPEGPEYWAHALYCAIVPCAEHEDEEIDTGYLLSKLVTEVIEGVRGTQFFHQLF